jgi:hypothetical protein
VSSSSLQEDQKTNATYGRNTKDSPGPSPLSLLASIKDEPDDEDDLIPQLEALFGMEGAPKLLLDEVGTPKYEPTPISELKSMPRNSEKDTLGKYNPQVKNCRFHTIVKSLVILFVFYIAETSKSKSNQD